MTRCLILLAFCLAFLPARSQDTLWFQHDNPSLGVAAIPLTDYDSVEFVTSDGMPSLRMYHPDGAVGEHFLDSLVAGDVTAGQFYLFNPAAYKYKVATIEITTEGGAPVVGKEKTDYVNCTVKVTSDCPQWNLTATARIRGRGNSSWLWYDKKPYRLKFDKKQPMLGLPKNKDWVLLANYRDATDLMNTFAFTMASGVGLPFTNHSRYVELTLNGDFLGLYQLTEQIEVANSRVDINEDGGILLSLDADDGPELSPDATDNFWSLVYKLPVCVKSPSDPTTQDLQYIQYQFSALENAIKSHDWRSFYANAAAFEFIDYLLIQAFVYNVEIAAPRSIYLYRDSAETRWHAGPVWDFDAGFDFEWANMYTGHDFFASYKETVLGTDPANHISNYSYVNSFFTDMWHSRSFVNAVRMRWRMMKDRIMSEFWPETMRYADGFREAMQRDISRWPIGKDPDTETERMKTWLTNRVTFMDKVVQEYPDGK